MDFLILIKNGCDNLTATVSPSVDSLGLHMVLSLATIMLVWFGVQEALASSHGGSGFNVAKFLNFFMLITFAYCFVKFYDGSIPGKPLTYLGVERTLFFFICVGAVGTFNLFNSLLAGVLVFIGGYAFGSWVTNADPAFLRILARSEKYKLRYDAAKQVVPRVEVH
jgi:type IV secretory pathway TrbD component